MDYVIYNGQLYHHGVKGMKWGVRKKQAKAAYKSATNKAFDDYERSNRGYADEKRYSSAVSKAKSDYKKAKQDIKAEKKQFKADVKAIKRVAGTTSTVVDEETGIVIGTRNNVLALRGSMQAKKGKEYADKVISTAERQLRNQAIAGLIGGTAVLAGTAYLSAKGY